MRKKAGSSLRSERQVSGGRRLFDFSFWSNLIGYQLVWFCAVIGAGQGMAWPGVVATLLFASWQLAVTRQRALELRLVAVGVALGLIIDGGLGASGLVDYAATWPARAMAPAWILTLWVAFALTVDHSLKFLQRRLLVAALLGAIGGPLAYLAAQRGWDAVQLPSPQIALIVMALAWGMAMPLLAGLARHWKRAAVVRTATEHA